LRLNVVEIKVKIIPFFTLECFIQALFRKIYKGANSGFICRELTALKAFLIWSFLLISLLINSSEKAINKI